MIIIFLYFSWLFEKAKPTTWPEMSHLTLLGAIILFIFYIFILLL